MGLGKSLKKLGKRVVSAVTDPKNLINPLFSVTELGEGVYNEYRQAVKADKEKEAARQQAEIDASNKAFQEDLDKKRRNSKRSKVIFAGVLGGNKSVGLGGQKNLLGL